MPENPTLYGNPKWREYPLILKAVIVVSSGVVLAASLLMGYLGYQAHQENIAAERLKQQVRHAATFERIDSKSLESSLSQSSASDIPKR